MNKYRYRTGCYCYHCKEEIFNISVCPKCGSSFLRGYSPHDSINPFATLRDIWVKEPIKLWNPFSWSGGYWEFDGIGRKDNL
jgi:hypothetical protein